MQSCLKTVSSSSRSWGVLDLFVQRTAGPSRKRGKLVGKLPRRGRLLVYPEHTGMGREERRVEDRLKSQPTNSWREPKGDVA